MAAGSSSDGFISSVEYMDLHITGLLMSLLW